MAETTPVAKDNAQGGIPAATVVIFRHAPDGGPPEILMTIRSREMVFAGGMAVFPGGRVDRFIIQDRHDAAAKLPIRDQDGKESIGSSCGKQRNKVVHGGPGGAFNLHAVGFRQLAGLTEELDGDFHGVPEASPSAEA